MTSSCLISTNTFLRTVPCSHGILPQPGYHMHSSLESIFWSRKEPKKNYQKRSAVTWDEIFGFVTSLLGSSHLGCITLPSCISCKTVPLQPSVCSQCLWDSVLKLRHTRGLQQEALAQSFTELLFSQRTENKGEKKWKGLSEVLWWTLGYASKSLLQQRACQPSCWGHTKPGLRRHFNSLHQA